VQSGRLPCWKSVQHVGWRSDRVEKSAKGIGEEERRDLFLKELHSNATNDLHDRAHTSRRDVRAAKTSPTLATLFTLTSPEEYPTDHDEIVEGSADP